MMIPLAISVSLVMAGITFLLLGLGADSEDLGVIGLLLIGLGLWLIAMLGVVMLWQVALG